MLTQLLKNPNPEESIDRFTPGWWRGRNPTQQQWQGLSRSSVILTAAKLGKVEFTNFIEENVKPYFSVNGYYADSHTPYIPNQLPRLYYKLLYIEEMHKDAIWDTIFDQPRVLSTKDNYGRIERKPPKSLRPLTAEEIKLVYLDAKKPEGSA